MRDGSNLSLMCRRSFLKTSCHAAIGLTLASPLDVLAKIPAKQQTLTFAHTHTGETLQLCYQNGSCSPAAKSELFSFLRDFRTGEVHPIDIRLINILMEVQNITGSKGVYEVISGYRSPKTNANLRTQNGGVAKKSLHMKGKAIDVRLTDLSSAVLRDAANSIKGGGVGYYAKSNFVHIDTGKVRSW